MLTVKSVEYHQDYELYIELSNGVCGTFNVFPYLEASFFKCLKNIDYFKTVEASFCSISWPE